MIRTFLVPPFTTIRGILSNACGLQRDDFSLQNADLKIGLRTSGALQRVIETSRALKYIARDKEERPVRRTFPSSPMRREFLLRPSYNVFLASESDKLMEQLFRSLDRPARPLYIGQSDDFVDISRLEMFRPNQTVNSLVSSIVEGVHPGCEVIRLPYKYGLGKAPSVLYKTFSIPAAWPYQLQFQVPCLDFESECVTVY